jgi:hypothetical protein
VIFDLQLHWGKPKHGTEIRSWTGSLGQKPPHLDKSIVSHCFISHEVVKWYGLSYKRVWFFGFYRFGVTNDQRSPELPSYTTKKERDYFKNYDDQPLMEMEIDDE